MIIDAEGLILGRVCTYAAKNAMLGEEVIVVNAEKAVISGKKDMILLKELTKLEIKNVGNPQHGPFHQKKPDRYVRRAIRGMLPWHKSRGREAFKKVMVYTGIPAEEIKKVHNIDLKQAKMERPVSKKPIECVTVAEICKAIGGKF